MLYAIPISVNQAKKLVTRLNNFSLLLCIIVTCTVNGNTRFVRKYIRGRRCYEVYIFLIRITIGVDIAMSVCPSV